MEHNIQQQNCNPIPGGRISRADSNFNDEFCLIGQSFIKYLLKKSRLDTLIFPYLHGVINLILTYLSLLHISQFHGIIAAPSISLQYSCYICHNNHLFTSIDYQWHRQSSPPLISSKFNRDCKRCRVIGRHVFHACVHAQQYVLFAACMCLIN